jgi:AcrR family transcriptional regulator
MNVRTASRPARRRSVVDVTPRAQSVLDAAVALFSEFGYHGTSMRDIAKLVGVGPGALYNHWPGKQDLLFYLMDAWLTELHNTLLARLKGVQEPTERLRLLVEHHVAFHAAHTAEMLICDSELRALTDRNRRVVLDKRRRYEAVLDDVIGDGVEHGAFNAVDVRLTTMQTLGMCTHVATWFKPEGRLSIDAIASAYADRVLHSLEPRR